MTTSSFFAFEDAISDTKRDLIGLGEKTEADYIPYIINNGLSYHLDCILYVNEMNTRPDMRHKLQFDFLRYAITKRKRWAKRPKPDPDEITTVRAVAIEYGISTREAREIIHLIDKDTLEIIKSRGYE